MIYSSISTYLDYRFHNRQIRAILEIEFPKLIEIVFKLNYETICLD